MLSLAKYAILGLLIAGLAACTAVDPSINDLKSPCAGGDGACGPKRVPSGNVVHIG